MAYWTHVGKTALNTVVESARNVLATVGRAGLHALAPDQFEYYMCSFELLDSKGSTVAFMNFPVMPNSISETEPKILEISKTNAGIVTMFNPSFAPKDISIQGTFGRKIRILAGIQDVPNEAEKKIVNILNGNLGFSMMQSEVAVKTGFGLVNLLRRIIAKTTSVDDSGMPYVLIFNNYALNVSYVVEILQSSFSQSTENNMLWFYSLEMRAVAPASAVKTESVKTFMFNVSANAIAQGVQSILSDSVRSLMQF